MPRVGVSKAQKAGQRRTTRGRRRNAPGQSSLSSQGPMDFFVFRSNSSYASRSSAIAEDATVSPAPPLLRSPQRTSSSGKARLPSEAPDHLPYLSPEENAPRFALMVPYSSLSQPTSTTSENDTASPGSSSQVAAQEIPDPFAIQAQSRIPSMFITGGSPILSPSSNNSLEPSSENLSSWYIQSLGSTTQPQIPSSPPGFATEILSSPSQSLAWEVFGRPSMPPLSDVTYTANLILRQIRSGLLGCTEAQHRFKDAAHHTDPLTVHQSLDATYAGASEFPVSIGLNSPSNPTQQGLARHIFPSGPVLSSLFTGCDAGSTSPSNICLHNEEVPPVFAQTTADIDSTIAFPSSLAVVKSEFYYCPTLQFQRKIQTDLHLERRIFYPSSQAEETEATLQLRQIPHLYLGSISGIFDCALYIFFPRLYTPYYVFECLTHEQMLRFTDYVMLSSILEHLPDATLQHLPPGFEASSLNAAARADETRTGTEESKAKTNRVYLLQSQYLADIWTSIQNRITQRDLIEFSDAFLCTMSKGHKLQFQGQRSLPLVTRAFYTKLESMFDFQYLLHDQLYIDLATEVCPAPQSPNTACGRSNQVYLFKRCCLERNLESFYQDDTTDSLGTNQFYNVKFLSEACNLTSIPPKKSRLWRAGLRYIQYYGSEKEICDAGTVYPFSNPGLEELSLDPGIWNAAASAAKWTGKRSRDTILESYVRSKHRVRNVYHASRKKSFGVRVEYRITSTIVHEIVRICQEQESSVPSYSSLPIWQRTPSFVWPILTERFVDFVLGNVHKFCATIEVTMLTSSKDGVRQSQSYLIYSLLKCLRFFFSRSALHIQPTLWYNEREDVNHQRRRGLGFESTLSQTGYGWFLPIVDWTQLQIIPEVCPDFVINQKEVLGFDWKTREARNAAWRLDDLLALLPDSSAYPEQQDAILVLMRHLCFRRFRQDVLLLLAKESFPGPVQFRAQIESDEVAFCYDDLSKYFQSPWLISQNRTALKAPEQIFDAFWGDGPAINRTHFQNKPYRDMFAKATGTLRQYPALNDVWLSTFKGEFYRFHTLLPYPDSNGTMISTDKSTARRRWWSVKIQGHTFAWAKNQPDLGSIPSYPATLQMSKEGFLRYLSAL